jgi:Zn-dependent protease with chaperone function
MKALNDRPALFAALALAVISLVSTQVATGQPVTAYLPYTGKADDEIKVAREYEEQFVRRGVRYTDPELQAIIDRVGEGVLPVVTDDFINFRLYLIRDPSPRAFSLADGQIYVHTGLLARLENEAQLAAVLAHEAHHVAAHHHIETDKHRRTRNTITGAVTLSAGPSDERIPDTLQELDPFHIARSEFTKEMEFEADAAAAVSIGNAGYSPAATVRALVNMRKDPDVTIESRGGAFSSGESLLERQGRLQVLLAELPQLNDSMGLAATRPTQLRRVIEMTIDDYIRLNRPGAALKLVDSMITEQPDAFLYAAKGDAHLALGPRPVDIQQEFAAPIIVGRRAEKTRKEINAKYLEMEGGPERLAFNLENAAEAYNTAIQMDDNYARAYRGLGNLHYEQDEFRPAGRNYVKYLKLESDSMDRQFILERLQHIKTELTKQKETGT